jgi:hypothetical protein
MTRIPQTIHGNSKTDGSTCAGIRNPFSNLKLKFAFGLEEYKARERRDQEEKSAERKGGHALADPRRLARGQS